MCQVIAPCHCEPKRSAGVAIQIMRQNGLLRRSLCSLLAMTWERNSKIMAAYLRAQHLAMTWNENCNAFHSPCHSADDVSRQGIQIMNGVFRGLTWIPRFTRNDMGCLGASNFLGYASEWQSHVIASGGFSVGRRPEVARTVPMTNAVQEATVRVKENQRYQRERGNPHFGLG